MATKKVANEAAARHAALLAQQRQQQLAMQPGAMPPGLVSPYDGTTPMGMAPGVPGGYPLEAGTGPGSLAGLNSGRPQVNATNQSALAPNGDINQSVSNENRYENKYYNIITTPYGVGGGMYNPAGVGWAGMGIGAGQYPYGQQCIIDPATGAMVCRDQGGIIGWFKRLFRGY